MLQYLAESFHEDIDISDKISGFSNDASQHESMTSSTSSLQSEIKVVVTTPRKETEAQGSFISYLVESQVKNIHMHSFYCFFLTPLLE